MYRNLDIALCVFMGILITMLLFMLVVTIFDLVEYGSFHRRHRGLKFTERKSGDPQHSCDDPQHYSLHYHTLRHHHGPHHHEPHHDAVTANNVAHDTATANNTAMSNTADVVPGGTHHVPHGMDGGDERSEHSDSVTVPQPTYQRLRNSLKDDMGSDESQAADSIRLNRTSRSPHPSMMDRFPLRVFRWGGRGNHGQTNGVNSRNSQV